MNNNRKRLTNLATRSEVARARELERLGLTQDWYDQQLQLQTVDDVPVCAECAKPESTRTKKWGDIRGLVVDQRTKDRLVCQRCASKFRSAKARTRIAEAIKEPEPETWLSLRNKRWKRNRKELKAKDPERYANLYHRSELVADLCASMELYTLHWPLNGPSALGELLDEADLQVTVNQVVHELRTRGSFNALNGTVIPPGGSRSAQREMDKDYEQFGFITRVPEWHPYDGGFEVGAKRFIHKFAPELESELYPEKPLTLFCSGGCKTSIQLSESDAKASFGYRCASCQQKTAVALRKFIEARKVTDSWGRPKLLGESQ